MLATIISKYLESNRRLVIPQLGAFLVKEPDHVVIFSQLLTKDDGVLLQLIIEQEVTEIEANGLITRLLFDIRYIVENGGEYHLDGVGKFTTSQEKSLLFEHIPMTLAEQAELLEQERLAAERALQEEKVLQEERARQEMEALEEEEEQEQEQEQAEIEEITEEESPEEYIETVEYELDEDAESDQEEEPIIEEVEEMQPAPREYRHVHFDPDPDLEGLSYGEPRRSHPSSRRHHGGGGPDWWMIIAIASVALAISVILYGFLREGAREGTSMQSMMERVDSE